jgi:hypothetical protein
VAGTGTGAATTFARTGVNATGTSGDVELVVAEGDWAVTCWPSVADEHDATVRATAKRTATMERALVGM